MSVNKREHRFHLHLLTVGKELQYAFMPEDISGNYFTSFVIDEFHNASGLGHLTLRDEHQAGIPLGLADRLLDCSFQYSPGVAWREEFRLEIKGAESSPLAINLPTGDEIETLENLEGWLPRPEFFAKFRKTPVIIKVSGFPAFAGSLASNFAYDAISNLGVLTIVVGRPESSSGVQRFIADHKTPSIDNFVIDNHIAIQVLDEPGPGNACHEYAIFVDGMEEAVGKIKFQKGPVQETGPNGLTNESLLAVVIDRLQGFQAGDFSCRENALALTKLQEAMHWLQHRTLDRLKRRVEGKNEQ